MITEAFITVEEASKILRVRRETVRRYIKEGHLPASTLPGGDFRLFERDVLKLLKQNRSEAS
jgi:excisionase family DNA binding protein